MKKYWKYGVIGGVAIGVLVASLLAFPNRSKGPALPVPNGYDDFLKAAENVAPEVRAFRDLGEFELRVSVNQNRSIVDLARLGSQRECRVAIEYNLAYLSNHMQVLPKFKMVARTFWAEGALAERERKTNDAARSYLDGIQFGQDFCRGGLVIDRLVGLACEALTFGPLSNLVQHLDARSCRELAQGLEKMDGKREPWESSVRRERSYFWKVASLSDNVFGVLQRVIRWCKSWPTPPYDARQNLERIQGWERRLSLQAAARAYELEHGNKAERPQSLVPGYLRAIPKDPITGHEIALQ